jgi:hypothetical protein
MKDERPVPVALTVSDVFALIVLLDQTTRRTARMIEQNERKGRIQPNGMVLTATGLHKDANPYKLARTLNLRDRLNAALEGMGVTVAGLRKQAMGRAPKEA